MEFPISGIFCLVRLLPVHLISQDGKDRLPNTQAISQTFSIKTISKVTERSQKFSGEIDQQTKTYLRKSQKQEASIQKKLYKIDSVGSKNIVAESQGKYQLIQTEIANKTDIILKSSGQYIPWVDTAITSLKFLQSKNDIPSGISKSNSQLQSGLRVSPAAGYETNKLFTTSDSDASQFGKNNFSLDGRPNTILKVNVPNSVMKTIKKIESIDGMRDVAFVKHSKYERID